MNEELSYSWRGKDGQPIRVTVESSPAQDNVCIFITEPPLYTAGGLHLHKDGDTADSPLAQKLFEIEGVMEVLIAGSSLTITTETAPEPDWAEMSEKIAQLIRKQVESGEAAVADSFTSKLPSAEELRPKVQEIIDSSINPAVASHGGVVTLLDVQGNNIFLEFGGGCQGCGMVSVTLKYGVERLIRENVPEVGQILDTTDHAAGQNPYYAPAAK